MKTMDKTKIKSKANGRREINRIQIRERLLKEALKLFSEKGFEKTTVSDIVERSKVGRGTFYNYFSDVKDIFDAIIDLLNENIRIVVREARKDATDIHDFLYLSYKSYFDYISEEKLVSFHRINQAYIRSTTYGTQSIQMIIADLQEDLPEHISRHTEYKESQMLSFVLVGTALEIFLNIHNTSIQVTNDEIAYFLARLFTNGLKVG